MERKIRLWQRDIDVLEDLKRWPMTTSQIAVLHGFPSFKKCAERLCLLYRAGFLKRVPYFQPAKQGKPEWWYGVKDSQFRERTMLHDYRIAALHVGAMLWLRTSAWEGEFFYTHELTTSSGIIADATLLLHKGEKHGLFYCEVDNGTEPVTSVASYSLAKKLSLYAAAWDNHTYTRDLVLAGTFKDFRVCIVLPPGRCKHVLQLLRREQHDFVMITSFDRLREGFGSPIWTTTEHESVDLLGRPGEVVGELVGELIGPSFPTTTRDKPCKKNALAQTEQPENPSPARTGQDA